MKMNFTKKEIKQEKTKNFTFQMGEKMFLDFNEFIKQQEKKHNCPVSKHAICRKIFQKFLEKNLQKKVKQETKKQCSSSVVGFSAHDWLSSAGLL